MSHAFCILAGFCIAVSLNGEEHPIPRMLYGASAMAFSIFAAAASAKGM